MMTLDLTTVFDGSEVAGTARVLDLREGRTDAGREYTMLTVGTHTGVAKASGLHQHGIPDSFWVHEILVLMVREAQAKNRGSIPDVPAGWKRVQGLLRRQDPATGSAAVSAQLIPSIQVAWILPSVNLEAPRPRGEDNAVAPEYLYGIHARRFARGLLLILLLFVSRTPARPSSDHPRCSA